MAIDQSTLIEIPQSCHSPHKFSINSTNIMFKVAKVNNRNQCGELQTESMLTLDGKLKSNLEWPNSYNSCNSELVNQS